MHRTSWIPLGLLAVLVGIALATPAVAATPNAWITTKTKLALLTTEGVSRTAIKVDTVGGWVTLACGSPERHKGFPSYRRVSLAR